MDLLNILICFGNCLSRIHRSCRVNDSGTRSEENIAAVKIRVGETPKILSKQQYLVEAFI